MKYRSLLVGVTLAVLGFGVGCDRPFVVVPFPVPGPIHPGPIWLKGRIPSDWTTARTGGRMLAGSSYDDLEVS